MRKIHLVLSALLSSFLLIGTSGCERIEDAAGLHAAKSSGLTSLQFHLIGIVLDNSPIFDQVTIEQAAVPGTMPATMAIYKVPSSSAFQALEPGDKIEAEAFIGIQKQSRRLSRPSQNMRIHRRRSLLPRSAA